MLYASTLLVLLLGQSVAQVKDAKSPVDLMSKVVTQLPSLAQVDLTGEVRKALAAARTPASSAPLRAR